MMLKDATVSLDGVNWRMFSAAVIAEKVYRSLGYELVITSANDGQHIPRDGKETLHHVGLALDFRIHDAPYTEWQAIRDRIAKVLGPDYIVILEVDHIHLQYKTRADYDAEIAIKTPSMEVNV